MLQPPCNITKNHTMVSAPTWPVMYAEAGSVARKRTRPATSSGVPYRAAA